MTSTDPRTRPFIATRAYVLGAGIPALLIVILAIVLSMI